MRIIVRHETTYTYRDPVRQAVQLLRLTPRAFDQQFVRRWRVTVDADARLDRSEDAYGNITHLAFIDGPVERLRILVEGEVETSDANGLVSGSVERLSPRLFLRETALTTPTQPIRDIAREAVAAEGGDRLACLHRINGDLHRTMAFKIGTTSAATKAGDAYAARTGVCQDFAHIMIAAARCIGVPARYVNGYLLRTDRTDQEAGHAWVEAFLPGLGWLAFDPAQGLCATDRYVRIAVGGDSYEAAPIRGARSGGHDETLGVAITVAQGRTVVSGPAVQSQSQVQSQSTPHVGGLQVQSQQRPPSTTGGIDRNGTGQA